MNKKKIIKFVLRLFLYTIRMPTQSFYYFYLFFYSFVQIINYIYIPQKLEWKWMTSFLFATCGLNLKWYWISYSGISKEFKVEIRKLSVVTKTYIINRRYKRRKNEDKFFGIYRISIQMNVIQIFISCAFLQFFYLYYIKLWDV